MLKNLLFAFVLLAAPAAITVGNAQNCTVDANNIHQRIDGFGASSAWQGTWTTQEANLFFSTNNNIVYTNKIIVVMTNNGVVTTNIGIATTNNGIGLSLLRNHIAYASSTASTAVPSTVETTIMKDAQALGARVWSTPWTPAAGFKSTGVVDGGNYLGSGANPTNLAYASQLANYVSSMKSQGINLYAISVQNEPDGNHPDPGGYESCVWNSTQIHDFTTNLYNAMVAKGVSSTMIMLPESQNWQDPDGLAGTAMNDPVVAADVGIVADHNYDGSTGPSSLAHTSYGKALWETEVSLLSGSDGSITNGVYYAQRIFLFMTNNVNAYHYWWLMTGNTTGNEGLTDNNAAVTKRMFAFGQYSRFVRPGYYRINANNASAANISAYENTNSGNFAIVAVNTNTGTAINQTITLTNFLAVSSVTPWMTTSNLSLASQTAVPVANSSFTYTLPALSIVTFVGQAVSNTVPVLAPVANQTINAGMTFVITNVATDTDSPPPTLTFSLLKAPANATLTTASGTNGIFTWRPFVSQANTTNAVSVQVTENGTPSLSATNNFTIIVNPLAQTEFSSIAISGGEVNLTINGAQGPDYTLLTSTNLINWQALFTTNSPLMPLTLEDTNFNDAMRFYSIQLGP
jgi:glucuronoarabinoxylan endo-1,4-beta-xylanase